MKFPALIEVLTFDCQFQEKASRKKNNLGRIPVLFYQAPLAAPCFKKHSYFKSLVSSTASSDFLNSFLLAEFKFAQLLCTTRSCSNEINN